MNKAIWFNQTAPTDTEKVQLAQRGLAVVHSQGIARLALEASRAKTKQEINRFIRIMNRMIENARPQAIFGTFPVPVLGHICNGTRRVERDGFELFRACECYMPWQRDWVFVGWLLPM